jgi:hypothetical protein
MPTMYHERVRKRCRAWTWRILCAGALAAGLLAPGCSGDPTTPIRVEGQTVSVENRSPDAWENVEIWLNDHYRVTRSRMPAGERFDVPLNAFVAGFGQRFVPGRQVVKGIEVTATGRGGQAVRLVWGEGRRR